MTVSALWYRDFGPPETVLRLEQRALPPLAPGRLRIRMLAAPVNPSDLIPITGAYRHRVVPPLVAGYEGVGRVIDAPENPDWVGRRVLPLRAGGTWQTVVDCTPDWLVPVPDAVDDMTAARAYINPLAALLMLKRFPVRGRRVVLTAARSGCARLLAAWARDDGALAVTGSFAMRRGRARRPVLRLSIARIWTASTGWRPRRISSSMLWAGRLAAGCWRGFTPAATFVTYGLLSGGPCRSGRRRRIRCASMCAISSTGWRRRSGRTGSGRSGRATRAFICRRPSPLPLPTGVRRWRSSRSAAVAASRCWSFRMTRERQRVTGGFGAPRSAMAMPPSTSSRATMWKVCNASPMNSTDSSVPKIGMALMKRPARLAPISSTPRT